jgi:alpha-beta hydrolase superfamily lysophospholipase
MPWEARTQRAGDGYVWGYRMYPPVGAARARLVCLHGIQSHAGWYEASCTALASQGFEVAFLDRRGSGVNTEARGDAPGYGRLLDDLAEFLCGLPADCPRVLLGVSWGGKLAVALQRRHPGLVQGLCLLCPGIRPKIRPSAWIRFRIAGASLLNPRRRFPIPLTDPELFTATPRWLTFLRTDPLALHEATARFLAQSFWLDGYLQGCPPHVTVPTLLLLAGHDAIIDNFATARYCEQFAGPLEILQYPEAFHTLEFEPAGPPFLEDLVWWLQRRELCAW